MAAHDELKTSSGFRKLLVLFIPNMSNRCNPRNVSRRLDLIDGVLNCLKSYVSNFRWGTGDSNHLDNVREDGAVVRVRNARHFFRCDADQGQAFILENVIWLDNVRHLLVG
jgi:hypothetical protein